jgi:endo-1,4-beta-xylanase
VGDWKIVSRTDDDNVWKLYHLAEDRNERNDLADQLPDKTEEMARRWTELHQEFERQATTHYAEDLPPHEPMLDVDFVGELSPQTTAQARIEIVEVEGMHFTQAVRVTNLQAMQQFYHLQLAVVCPQPVSRADVLLVRFHARGSAPADETGEARGNVYFQQHSPDWHKMLSVDFRTTSEWRRYDFPFVAGRDYAAGATALCFGLGYGRQEIEIGGVEFLRMKAGTELKDLPRTPVVYSGSEPDAAWRSDAAARIEEHRKGNLTVTVLDDQGRPVPDAAVEVEMTRHAFQFSSVINIPRYVSDGPGIDTYRRKVRELFNATGNENALKWPVWERSGGPYRRDDTLTVLRQFREEGFHVRGHVMVWPGWRWLPSSIQNLRDTPGQDRIPQLVLDHIREIGAATRDVVHEWDVLNEPRSNHDLMDLFGRDIMIDWFKAAREVLPAHDLYINDYAILNTPPGSHNHRIYQETIRFLLDGGAPVTGIGFQGHLGSHLPNPAQVFQTLEDFAALGLKMRITEFDIDIHDEEAQARYTRDFMTVMFSHPAVVGFQMWGFWEGSHWRPNGAMYRRNWEPKPNALAYRDLVLREWWTKESATTGPSGDCVVRGFLGDYRVTARSGDRTTIREARLEKAGTELIIRFE